MANDRVSLLNHTAAHTDRIWRLRASHTGELIASCSADGSVAIWRVSKDQSLSLQLVQRLQPGNSDPVIVRDCAFSANDQHLVVAAYNGSMYVYDLVDDLIQSNPFQLTAIIANAHEKEIKSVDISKDGTVAACSRDRFVSFWRPCSDSPDYDCIGLFNNHTEDIKCVRFSRNGSYLVSASYDNNICIYKRNIEDGDELGEEQIESWVFAGATKSELDLNSCELNAPDSEIIASGASCHTVWTAIFSSNNTSILTVDGNGCLRYYNVIDSGIKQLACTILHGRRPIYDISLIELKYASKAFNTYVITAGQDGAVCLSVINITTGSATPIVYITGAHDGEVNTVCDITQYASGDGHAVVCSGGDDGYINMWRIATEEKDLFN